MITIYLITNLINNKKYVGQTKRSLENRWKNHINKTSTCTHLKNSIKYYGQENFKIEAIASILNNEYACMIEDYFIDFFQTFHPNGYNLIMSEERGVISDKTRRRLGYKSKQNWNREEYRNKKSKQLKDMWTDELKAKQSENQKKLWENKELATKRLTGIKEYVEDKQLPIVGVSIHTGNIIKFSTINDCIASGNYPYGSLKGKDLYNNGYTWFYDENLTDDEYRSKALQKIGKFDDIEIRQVKYKDIKTNEEVTFKNLDEAKLAGFNKWEIKLVLRGKKKTYNNKIWELC